MGGGGRGRLARTNSFSPGSSRGGRPGSALLERKLSVSPYLMQAGSPRALDKRQVTMPGVDFRDPQKGWVKGGENRETRLEQDRSSISAWESVPSSLDIVPSSWGFGRLPSPREMSASAAGNRTSAESAAGTPPGGAPAEAPTITPDFLVPPISKEVYTQSEVIAFRVAQARQIQQLHGCYEERTRALQRRHQVQMDDLRQQIAAFEAAQLQKEEGRAAAAAMERTKAARPTAFAFSL